MRNRVWVCYGDNRDKKVLVVAETQDLASEVTKMWEGVGKWYDGSCVDGMKHMFDVVDYCKDTADNRRGYFQSPVEDMQGSDEIPLEVVKTFTFVEHKTREEKIETLLDTPPST